MHPYDLPHLTEVECVLALHNTALLTLTAEATSSGSCTSSPSLQVYKQSITFLFSSLPERIISPARFPRKNWAILAFPPGYIGIVKRRRTRQHAELLKCTSHRLRSSMQSQGATLAWMEFMQVSMCALTRPEAQWGRRENDGWETIHALCMQHLH